MRRNGKATSRSLVLPSQTLLYICVFLGVALGALYAATNTWLDGSTWAQRIPIGFVTLHTLVDRGIPLVAGGLFGVAVWAWRLRVVAQALEGERAARLDERLAHVERDQAVFVVAASALHELNNPLHTLGLMLDEATELGEGPERSALLKKSRTKLEHLQARIGALRDIAKPGMPLAEPPTSVEVDGVVAGLVTELAPVFERNQVSLSTTLLHTTAIGNATWLRIALENLLVNAVDGFTESREMGHVDIRIEQPKTQGVVQVVVSDDGPGLDSTDERVLFQALGSKKQHGLGLGLPISRALARSMGGDLIVETRAGWTTSFVLQLKASR